VPILLEAINRLPPGLNIHFLLAGTNMDNPDHRKRVANNTYADNIHLHGFLKRMPWILPNCHVAVLPSLRREGLPRGIIEAMIGGAVPIVTDSGGCPELIEEGISGYIVPPGESQPITDKILALIKDRDLHARLSKGAQQRIRDDFKVEDTAINTIAMYQDVILGR
jgi:glycosyltransferase involved in cell wall biosynthesis